METFSALLAIGAGNSPVPGEFPIQRPVTRSFNVFLDQRLNKRLSKQWWGWWFKTLSRPLWRHRNEKHQPNWVQTSPLWQHGCCPHCKAFSLCHHASVNGLLLCNTSLICQLDKFRWCLNTIQHFLKMLSEISFLMSSDICSSPVLCSDEWWDSQLSKSISSGQSDKGRHPTMTPAMETYRTVDRNTSCILAPLLDVFRINGCILM